MWGMSDEAVGVLPTSDMQYDNVFEHALSYGWNDLQLAAELGKTLLERNKDLETQLKQSHQTQHEQNKEIELLTKQLDVLRTVNDSRMRIYEEVDKNLQESEKVVERLRGEVKVDKEKINTQTEAIQVADQKCEDLQLKIDQLKEDARKRHKRDRRTWSTPSLVDVCDSTKMPDSVFGYECNWHEHAAAMTDDIIGRPHFISEHEVRELKKTIGDLKQKLSKETRKRNELDTDMAYLAQENDALTKKVDELEKQQQRIGTLENELEVIEIHAGKLCRMCGGKLEQTNVLSGLESAIEHEDDEVVRHGKLVRLKNGGSAYGSRESLHTLGLDEESYSPINDLSPSRDIHDVDSIVTPSRPQQTHDSSDVSILGELEDQYRRLVRKYEALVEAKNKRSPGKDIGIQENLDTPVRRFRPMELAVKNANRKSGIDFKSPIDPTDSHFDNGPPEYKRLFKEIFDTLRRSVVQEGESPISPSEILAGAAAEITNAMSGLTAECQTEDTPTRPT